MSEHNLVLFPRDERHRLVSHQGLLDKLREIGLIGEPSQYGHPHEYQQGLAFFRLVRFRTHHMVVELVPDDTGGLKKMPPAESTKFCSVRAAPGDEVPNVIASPYTTAPRCRSCGRVEDDWPDLFGRWFEATRGGGEFRYACPGCEARWAINELDWSHTGGVACHRIDIQGVSFGEAAPSQELLDVLREWSGISWDYCYYRL